MKLTWSGLLSRHFLRYWPSYMSDLSTLSNSDHSSFRSSSVAAEKTRNCLSCNLSRCRTLLSNILTGAMLSLIAGMISGFFSPTCHNCEVLVQLATMASCSSLICCLIKPTHEVLGGVYTTTLVNENKKILFLWSSLLALLHSSENARLTREAWGTIIESTWI